VKTIWVLARLTFLEAGRRRILWAALLLGIVFQAIFALGFHYVQEEVLGEMNGDPSGPSFLQLNEIRNFLLIAGLYVVNFLTVMMAVLTSVDTLSGEIGAGTIQSLVTKPIRRREVVLGKWLGFAILLSLYILMMAGGVIASVYLISGYLVEGALRGLGLIWLNGLLMVSLSMMGGAGLSTLANGVLVFGLFGVAFVGGWIEHIGSFLDSQAAINIGVLTSLILPSEALWRRAAFEMRSPLVDAIGFSPFTSAGSVPSPLMIAYALGYVVAVLAWGLRIFDKRDL